MLIVRVCFVLLACARLLTVTCCASFRMELTIILFLVVSLLHIASCAPMGLYGFAQPVTATRLGHSSA